MYLIFRCDCGRAMYSREGVVTRKCVCGKNIKVKSRRILKRAEDFQSASQAVRDLQEERYGGTGFTTANKL
ncbi:MAG: DUF1922 domain-containing protein [Euryarchaeota archaeon]|nr:DUF1922 domain-containing protein [Euryarchaeota archaeon]MBV1729305.1 DUF1922 domain-containing protein [Methanobacterium sp.]MBV1755526.1 DUF1922 domain-containing protein [Methanobacterium sp.]